jgi:hypothetical protein
LRPGFSMRPAPSVREGERFLRAARERVSALVVENQRLVAESEGMSALLALVGRDDLLARAVAGAGFVYCPGRVSESPSYRSSIAIGEDGRRILHLSQGPADASPTGMTDGFIIRVSDVVERQRAVARSGFA